MEDEVFFSVHNEDFHPTDVGWKMRMGMLLIIEPEDGLLKDALSLVSKPGLKDHYRVIRKTQRKPMIPTQ